MQNTSSGPWANRYNTTQPPLNYTQALPYSVANRSMQNMTSAETYMANYVVGIVNDLFQSYFLYCILKLMI